MLASLLFIPWGNDEPWFFPVLNVGWTLNFELLFYLMFALSLFLPRKSQLVGLGALFLSLGLLWLTPAGASLPWRFWGHPIILEFLAGALLAVAWRKRGAWALAGTVLASMIVAVALARLTPYPVRTFPLGIACLLVTGAVLLEHARPPIRLPLFLGDASYSIYLWHYLGIRFAAFLFRPPESLLGFAIYFAAGAALGLAAHLAVERPLRNLIRGRRPN